MNIDSEKLKEGYKKIIEEINLPHMDLKKVGPKILDIIVDVFGADRADLAIIREDFDINHMALTEENAIKLRITKGYKDEEWRMLVEAGVLMESIRHAIITKESTQTEISSVSDFVLLAVQPQAGDEIQLMKAGIMEIADIIAVTKCDMLDPYSIKSALMGAMGHRKVKFFETGVNLPEKYDILFEELKTFNPEHKRETLKSTLEWLIMKHVKDEILPECLTDELIDEISVNNYDPFRCAGELFNKIFNKKVNI